MIRVFISRLVLENIWTHRHSELVFDTGLSVVVGESGYGKTAVARALGWLLAGGERPEDLISQAGDRCRVTATTADRVRLHREWDGSRETFTVSEPGRQPRSFDVRRAPLPPEIRRKYTVQPSVLAPELVLHLQLAAFGEELFLINQPPTVKARTLGSLQGVAAAEAALADIGAAPANIQTEVHRLITRSIDGARRQAGRELERFVTAALREAFAADLRLMVEYTPEAGARYIIVSRTGGGEVAAPAAAHGRGIAEFTALALRLAFIVTARPPLPGPVVLDEPCPAVSDQYVANIARFLKATADHADIQIIMLTFNQRVTEAADSVNVLLHADGITRVQHRGGSIRAKSRPR